MLAVINQEDLSGETEQQNLPGSTWQYPNWRRKMRMTVEQLAPLADKSVGDSTQSASSVAYRVISSLRRPMCVLQSEEDDLTCKVRQRLGNLPGSNGLVLL